MYDRLLLYFRLARLTPYFSVYYISGKRPPKAVFQLVEKVHPDFFDKLPAKSQNKKLHFILRFWSLRRVIEREREP